MLSKLRLVFSAIPAVSVAAVIALAGAAGCVASSSDDGAAAGSADGATGGDAETTYRTIVRFAPDGSFTQSVEVIRPEDQQADQAARAAYIEAVRSGGVHSQLLPTLGVEKVCSSASLWLYDQANRTGNQLCLIKAVADDMAWLDLGTICRGGTCLLHWANAVRSLWAGDDPGSLQSCTATLCFVTPFVNFGVLQQINSIAAGSPHPLNWAFLFTP